MWKRIIQENILAIPFEILIRPRTRNEIYSMFKDRGFI